MTGREAWPLDGEGVWRELAAAGGAPRPALFLDRDGVIVAEVDHLCRPEDVELMAGATALIAAANRAGAAVVVVTNQSGIGRGLYGWAEFDAVQREIARRLAAANARWDAVMASPFHPEGRAPWRHPDHPARKPNPGMLTAAAEALGLDLASSWILGDRASDTAAGRRAGLEGGLFVGPGYYPGEAAEALAQRSDGYAVARIATPAEAPRHLPFLAPA